LEDVGHALAFGRRIVAGLSIAGPAEVFFSVFLNFCTLDSKTGGLTTRAKLDSVFGCAFGAGVSFGAAVLF
jgi:hypothetical protein